MNQKVDCLIIEDTLTDWDMEINGIKYKKVTNIGCKGCAFYNANKLPVGNCDLPDNILCHYNTIFIKEEI